MNLYVHVHCIKSNLTFSNFVMFAHQQPVAMLPAANCDEQISGCCPRSNVDVSTQTIQTSFSICNDCDTKNYNLMNLVQTLETQCINVCGKSSLNEKNWKQAIETGGLREKDIRERFKQDLSAIVDAHNRYLY